MSLVGSTLGREIFPIVDTGQFQLHLRAPAGTRIERTEPIALKTLDVIKREVGPENVEHQAGFRRHAAAELSDQYDPSLDRGSEEAVLQVQLKPATRHPIEELKERLRQKLPEELPDVRFSFEPSDIVSRVMSFGAPTPIEVAVSGPNLAEVAQYAEKLGKTGADADAARPRVRAGTRLPDRQGDGRPRAGRRAGRDRRPSRIAGRRPLVQPLHRRRTYWADPKSGIGYQVQVQIPQHAMNSIEDVQELAHRAPIRPADSLLRKVAERQPTARRSANTTATTCSAC